MAVPPNSNLPVVLIEHAFISSHIQNVFYVLLVKPGSDRAENQKVFKILTMIHWFQKTLQGVLIITDTQSKSSLS